MIPWLLSGGWKWLAGAALIAGAYFYITSLQATAARVPILEEQIRGKDALILAHQQADMDREAVDKKLSAWGADLKNGMAAIRKGMTNAPVHTNPLCFPTADDRRVRNEAFNELLPIPAVPAQ